MQTRAILRLDWVRNAGLVLMCFCSVWVFAEDQPKPVQLLEMPARKAIPTPGPLKGAVLAENSRMSISIQHGASSISINFNGADKSQIDASVQQAGQAHKLSAVEVVRASADEAELKCSWDAGVTASLHLKRTSATLRASGPKGCVVRIAGAFPYAYRPDFFGTDTVYMPWQSPFVNSGAVEVPVRSYLAASAGPHAGLLLSWTGGEHARLSARREEKIAVFDALEAPLAGEGSWVALGMMAAPQAFLSKDLRNAKYSEQFKDNRGVRPYALMETPWKPPFEARWNTLIYHGERTVKDHNSLPAVRAWPMQLYAPFNYDTLSGAKPMTKELTWRKEGKFWDNDAWLSHPLRATVADGQDWTLILEQVYGKHEWAFLFPLDRTAGTPAHEATITDLLRDAFGADAAKILDVEGHRLRWELEPGKLAAVAACPGEDCYIEALRKKKDPKLALVAARSVEYFLLLMDRRTQEYLKFGVDLTAFCQEEAQKNQSLQPLAQALVQTAATLPARWRRCQGYTGSKEKTEEYFGKLCAVLSESGDLAQIESKLKDAKLGKFRDRGLFYDYFVSAARKIVERMIHLAAMQGSGDHARAAFASEVLERCHAIVRNGVQKDTVYTELHWVPFGFENMQTMPGYNPQATTPTVNKP